MGIFHELTCQKCLASGKTTWSLECFCFAVITSVNGKHRTYFLYILIYNVLINIKYEIRAFDFWFELHKIPALLDDTCSETGSKLYLDHISWDFPFSVRVTKNETSPPSLFHHKFIQAKWRIKSAWPGANPNKPIRGGHLYHRTTEWKYGQE